MRKIHATLLVLVGLSGAQSGAALAEKNLFGTLHGHSNWSIDAFGIGNTSLGPEKAYEFARGEKVTHLNGAEVQLSQPLDFFMLSDHAEMMGTAPGFIVEGSPTYDTEIARLARDGKATEAFTMIGNAIVSGTPLEGLGDPEVTATLWSQYVALADEFNEERPHDALQDMAPVEYLMAKMTQENSRNLQA